MKLKKHGRREFLKDIYEGKHLRRISEKKEAAMRTDTIPVGDAFESIGQGSFQVGEWPGKAKKSVASSVKRDIGRNS